jgi:putative spermidine/putrescine transport system substrate-binding protein
MKGCIFNMKINPWIILSIVLIIIIIGETIYITTLTQPTAPAAKPTPPSRYDQISQADLIKYALEEGVALSYGMPPGWAHYGIQWKFFTEIYGIQHSDTDMGSAVVVATLEAAKGHPDADVADLGASYAMIAAEKGLTDCYIPPHFDAIPPEWKDPNGCWLALYTGTIGFVVNVDALKAKGVPIPRSWKDLLKPEYKGMIVYQDPTKTATGLLTIVAAAYANGGDVTNWRPGLDFIKELHKRGNIKSVPPLVPTADYQKGEIPILINLDYNGLTYKYTPGFPNTEFIIPEDGTITRAHAVIIAKGAPHPFVARLYLNFYMSDLGSLITSLAFARPTRQDYTPPEFISQLFPPKELYAKAVRLDEKKLREVSQNISEAWSSEVLPLAGGTISLVGNIDGFVERDPVPRVNPYLLEKAMPLILQYISSMKQEVSQTSYVQASIFSNLIIADTQKEEVG